MRDLVIKMRNLSDITMNHFERHRKPRRWSRFPYFGREADRTHRSHGSPALLQSGQNIFQTNGMLTGWFHGPTHLLWFIKTSLWDPSHPPLPKKGQNINLYRKKDKRISLKDTCPRLWLSRRSYWLFFEFWLNMPRKRCVLDHDSCHSGSISLLRLGREVITLWWGGGDSLISMWMELITNANCNQKGISAPNGEIITWLCW